MLVAMSSAGHKDSVRLCCLQLAEGQQPEQWQLLSVLPPLAAVKPTGLFVSPTDSLVMVTTQHHDCDALWCLDESSSRARWRLLTSFALPGGKRRFFNASVCLLGETLIVAGGYSQPGSTRMSDCTACYHLVHRTWLEWPVLPCPRADGRLVHFEEKLLLLGGVTENVDDKLHVDSYDFSSKASQWVRHASSPCPRAGASYAVHGQFLLSCGGHDADSPSADVFAWSPLLQYWLPLPSLIVARLNCELVAHSNTLLCIGGDVDRTVSSWTCKVERMAVARKSPSV